MTSPVVTVTLNPAIDRTVWLDHLVPGATNRSGDTFATIGGKGINVARHVARLGHPALALGIAGEDQAAAIERHLDSLGVTARFLPTPGETRTNFKLIERTSGRLTEINGAGPIVARDLLDAFERELILAVERHGARAVVLSGSLPRGVDGDVYARWIDVFHGRPEVRVILDASDAGLAYGVAARPFLVKPNRVEAESIVGAPIANDADARAAATAIHRLGPRGVLLSLGSDGAVACWEGACRTILPRSPDEPRSGRTTTVGAGDAMVARMAVGTAIADPAIDATAFFALCEAAVAEAERHIRSVAPTTPDASGSTHPGERRAVTPPTGPQLVEAPMSEP